MIGPSPFQVAPERVRDALAQGLAGVATGRLPCPGKFTCAAAASVIGQGERTGAVVERVGQHVVEHDQFQRLDGREQLRVGPAGIAALAGVCAVPSQRGAIDG